MSYRGGFCKKPPFEHSDYYCRFLDNYLKKMGEKAEHVDVLIQQKGKDFVHYYNGKIYKMPFKDYTDLFYHVLVDEE